MKETVFLRTINIYLFIFVDNETKIDVLWKKIESMFETKNALNRSFVFRKIVRLRYQDGSSMAEHLNVFQGLINQTVFLDIPLIDHVLALLLLGSLLDSWKTIVVTLGNSTPQGKMILDTLKSSHLNEEA